MRNKVVKKLLIIAMAVTMISGTSIATVYANANPPAEETTTEVVQETSTETTEDTEKKEDTGRVTGEGDNSAFSTPLTLMLPSTNFVPFGASSFIIAFPSAFPVFVTFIIYSTL